MTLFENEIYSEPRDPFLTVGKMLIVLVIVVFIALALNVELMRAEMKMHEAEKSMQN